MISNCMGLDQRWVLVGQVGSSHVLTSGGCWWVRMHTMRVEYKKYLEPKVQGFVLECELPSTGRQARVTGMCCNALGVYLSTVAVEQPRLQPTIAPGADT